MYNNLVNSTYNKLKACLSFKGSLQYKSASVSACILIGLITVANAEQKKACYSVEGMTCSTCSITLKVAVKKLDGIASVQASADKKNAVITYDSSKTSAEAIGKKIDSVGYTSTKKECAKLEDKKDA